MKMMSSYRWYKCIATVANHSLLPFCWLVSSPNLLKFHQPLISYRNKFFTTNSRINKCISVSVYGHNFLNLEKRYKLSVGGLKFFIFNHNHSISYRNSRSFSKKPEENYNKSKNKALKSSSNENNMAKILSGREASDDIKEALKSKISKLGIKPCLAIIQVGNREDSNVYIRMKIKFAESIGATAFHKRMSRDTTEQELIGYIKELNADENVHGIITQLPFDTNEKIDANKITNMIDHTKDVDGLTVINAGHLLHGTLDDDSFVPCTPKGCLDLIKRSGIDLKGKHCVVVGRSKIVGAPMAQLLVWQNATVTICHSHTQNIEKICREADVLVVAVGRAEMIKGSWLKPGAVVIDCGINSVQDETKKSGFRLVGDVDYNDCLKIAGAITPVPGGVGPMTVAMLVANTVESAARRKTAN